MMGSTDWNSNKRKERKANKKKAGQNLGYFSLWRSRMEREGVRKDATVMSARSMLTFMIVGKEKREKNTTKAGDIKNIQN